MRFLRSKSLRRTGICIFVFLLAFINLASAQSKTFYVCSPCYYGCDQHDKRFENPGRCPSCAMKLIEEGKHDNETPQISPDGSKLLFISTRDNDVEIYVMEVDGSHQKRLTHSKGEEGQASWSPDGNKILFISYRDDRTTDEVYIMNADGSEQKNLSNHPKRDHWPAFSPDGKKVVFNSNRESDNDIYVMNIDGSGLTRLTKSGSEDRPKWSGGGKKIIFRSKRSGDVETYKMNVDGSAQTRVRAGHTIFSPISPDGAKMVFRKREERGHSEIVLRDLKNNVETTLTNTPGFDNQAPVWSPNGARIFFHSDRDGNREIYVMDADGSNLRRLTFSRKDGY